MKSSMVVLLVSLALTGCETMLAHVKMSDQNVATLAKGNVLANTCASKGYISADVAGEYNYWAALDLEQSVISKDVFRNTFEASIYQITQMSDFELRDLCAKAGPHLAAEAPRIRESYLKYSNWLSSARALEWQSISTSLAQIGSDARSTAGAISSIQRTIPVLNFQPHDPKSTEVFLVRTNSGLSQCHVTNKSYVFCY